MCSARQKKRRVGCKNSPLTIFAVVKSRALFNSLVNPIVDSVYTSDEYPALALYEHEWAQTQPFDGLRVLAATPVFRNTLLQYRALIAGGADLVVGIGGAENGATMPCDDGVVRLLRESGIPVIGLQDALDAEAEGHGFDLILDCAGQFSACHPRFGFVELTRSGVQFYEKCEHPVYVADSGIVKRIETCLGTGEGYVRALAQLGYDFGSDAGKKFVVFGSGKVGQGIVLQLLRSGASVQVVTDCSRGSNPFLDANDVSVTDCNDLDAVAALVRDADFVVTATGVKGALDRPQVVDALLASNAVLANMGVEDEYGPSIPATRVLAEKKPLNFILEEPTHLKYIDASLALHAALGEQLLREAAGANKNAGPLDPPSELEQRILSMTMQDGLIGPEIAEMMGW
ncbi:MAG: adenosylhomocysteinase [Fibrobacter sp.]|nr:adenosylhomocysteinase [Fibrobacter sp.]